MRLSDGPGRQRPHPFRVPMHLGPPAHEQGPCPAATGTARTYPRASSISRPTSVRACLPRFRELPIVYDLTAYDVPFVGTKTTRLSGCRTCVDRSHRDARFGRALSVLLFEASKRGRVRVVSASQRRLWYLAIGSLRTVLVEHVEPDEFGASRFLVHVSIFLPTLVSWQAAQKAEQPPIPIRLLFDCRHLQEKFIRPRAAVCATGHGAAYRKQRSFRGHRVTSARQNGRHNRAARTSRRAPVPSRR
jgi:hypothetical protein